MDTRIDRRRLELPVLMETPHELAVVKPAGMATELSHDAGGVSLVYRVRACLPPGVQPRLPHRLDRVSRGIVVIALTQEAIAYHNEQLRQRTWDKIYLARCLAPAGRAEAELIGRHRLHLRPQGGRARVVRSGGQPAVTEILDVAPVPDAEAEIHVLVRLLTGRMHQIRATMAHLGAPLVDDWIYGSSPGRSAERFYLEHLALRFTLFEQAAPCLLHWAEDPLRERIAPSIQETLDVLLARWENGGARWVGGHHAEKRGDQGARS
jgi:23S rRNA-/tRNA-specific pseudouridylate synthase